MKVRLMRVLSLLLVLVLAMGLFPAAAEATAYEDPYLPDPIEAYDPLDPYNPYPYGIPVTDYAPEDIRNMLEGYENGISLMASENQGSIPDEMWDNTILRALEYTGYDVQRQKDNGQLYEYRYIGSRLPSHDPAVLSDITYWTSGWLPNGDNTVDDPSTPTGKAPNIAAFEQYGMVCASFATYYLCNYLPNIEGIDTSVVYEKAKELGTDASTGSYYLTTVGLWKRTLDALANDAGSGVTKYTDEDTAYENLVPGDVVIFGRSDGDLTHVAIYAGAYDLYSYGSNLGEYHYMIHVGNSRGPEISIIEWMSTASGDKAADPVGFYHLDFNDIQAEGYIEVNKTDPNGAPLAGAYFTATDQSTGTNYVIGPTDSNGYAISDALPLSKFTVVESVFPTGYQASGETSWEVELTKDTPNMTITINAINELTTGKAKIVKETTNGGSKAGWHFTVTDSAGNKVGDYVTDASGVIVLDVLPGVYHVSETDGSNKYWVNDPEPTKTITVKANETATVTFTNRWRGQAQIIKTATNGGSVAGWHFTVKDSAGNMVGEYVTDASGVITLDLEPGTFSVTETDSKHEYWHNDPQPTKTVTVKAGETAKVTFNNQWIGKAKIVKTTTNGGTLAGWEFTITDANGSKIGTYVTDSTGTIVAELEPGSYTIVESDKNDPYWFCDTEPKTITVKAGETAEVTFHNQWIGKAKIVKTATNGGTVEGWEFTIHDANGNKVGTYVTDSTGTIVVNLEPGSYTISESEKSDPYWHCDTEPRTVTVKAGETAEVAFQNQWIGKAKIIKTLANPEAGSVEGWKFTISRVIEANGEMDAEYITTVTTGADGTIAYDLEPGDYLITELIEEDSLWECITENSQVVTVVAGQTTEVPFTNALRPGRVSIHKVDTRGEPLDSTEFLLEWSEDGVTWQPVSHTDSEVPQIGGCTSAGLAEGKLISDENGLVTFEGLYPTLQYRLTETVAKEGYQLLADHAYVGGLSVDNDLVVQLKVVNASVFSLPETGSTELMMQTWAVICCLCICAMSMLLLIPRTKRKDR